MIKILCPTDFSDAADNAIAYAAALSKKTGAELTLFNVQSMMSLPVVEIFNDKVLTAQPIVEKLEAQSHQVMDVFNITCLTNVQPENGLLVDIIAKRSKDFDLLIMGTNGADDYGDYFFGSHSYQVAIESLIPVLLIPSACSYKEIATMVYAYDYDYDYEHEQQLPMVQLSKWVEFLKAKITVLKVKSHYSREVEVSSQEIEERIVNSNGLPDVKFDTVYEDDAFRGVQSYFVKNEYDALALCSIQHSFITNIFHKSLIQELSSGGNYPLFIFHK
jgi:nucleotide-binding universal stress UspA family protein